jgi:hypothetical protein
MRFIAAAALTGCFAKLGRYVAGPNTIRPRQAAKAWPKAGEREENGPGSWPRASRILVEITIKPWTILTPSWKCKNRTNSNWFL